MICTRATAALLLACGCWLASSPPVRAEPGVLATGRAQAEVVIPIRATPLSDLSFGSIAIGSSGVGTVEVAPDGAPPRYANTTRSGCSAATDCMPHRASFAVSGEPNRTYAVTLPTQIVAYGLRTGAGLPVTDVAMRSINAPSATNGGRLDSAGRDSFFIGGILRLAAGTRPDVFRAELPVIVSYN